MAGRETEDLWQNYRFLTKEMVKFLTKQDIKLFYDLLSQRERLQTIIEQTVDDGYRDSPEGQNILCEIQQDSQTIISKLESRMLIIQRQHQVNISYNSRSIPAISRNTWQR